VPLRPLPAACVRLLIQVRACNRRCICETGDTDPQKVAKLIASALRADPAVLTGLSHFISAAIDGEVLDFDAEQASDQAVGH
jgi:hypothetical protein